MDAPAIEEDVAPRAGAWIETLKFKQVISGLASPPARGRGLKRHRTSRIAPAYFLPLCMGAKAKTMKL